LASPTPAGRPGPCASLVPVGIVGFSRQSRSRSCPAATAAYGVASARACIVGLSYGGYAAMSGAVFHPEVYRCAVSVSGVSDLPLWIGATRRAYGEDSYALAYWRTAIGDPRVSSSAMIEASPVRRLGAGSSPILLMHGDLDTTVPLEQSRTMERRLKELGQAAPLIILEGDDHDLSKSKSRIKFLSETEAFLGKHLPVAP
jgi:dipeptidyl aminopeptidase/acylaminoacyl peptidase